MSDHINQERKAKQANERETIRRARNRSLNSVSDYDTEQSPENEEKEKFEEDYYATAHDLGFQPICFDHTSGLWKDVYKWIFRKTHISKDFHQAIEATSITKIPDEGLVRQKSVPKVVKFGSITSRTKDTPSPQQSPTLAATLSKLDKNHKLPPLNLQQVNQNPPQKVVPQNQREYILKALKQEHVVQAMKDIERCINNLAKSPRILYDEQNSEQYEKLKKKQMRDMAEVMKKNVAQLFDKHGNYNPLRIGIPPKSSDMRSAVATTMTSPEKLKEKRTNEKNSEQASRSSKKQLDDSSSTPLDSERMHTNSKKANDKADGESITRKDSLGLKDQEWRTNTQHTKKSADSINSIDNELNQQKAESKLHRRKSDSSHYYGGECKKITKLCHLFLPLQFNVPEIENKQDEPCSLAESNDGANAAISRKSIRKVKLTSTIIIKGKGSMGNQITEKTEEGAEDNKNRNSLDISPIKRVPSMNKSSDYRVLSQKFDPVKFVPRTRLSIAQSHDLRQNSLTRNKFECIQLEEPNVEEVEGEASMTDTLNLSQRAPISQEKVPTNQDLSKQISFHEISPKDISRKETSLKDTSPRGRKEVKKESMMVTKMKKELEAYHRHAEDLAKKNESMKTTSRYHIDETEKDQKVFKKALITVLSLNSKAKSSLFRNSLRAESNDKAIQKRNQSLDPRLPEDLVTMPAKQLHVSDLKRPVTVIKDKRYSFEYVDLNDEKIHPYAKTANLYVPNTKQYSHDCEKLVVGVGPKKGAIVKGYSMQRRTQSEIKIRPKNLTQSNFRR